MSHDVRKFFGLLLKKNGYVLGQLFSPLMVHTTPEHAELKTIVVLVGVSGSGKSTFARPGAMGGLLTVRQISIVGHDL